MKTQFSKTWKASVKPGKQRKYAYNAPYHVRHRMMSAHLSPELRKVHGKRNLPVRKGDVIKVLRGSFRKQIGKVNSVNMLKMAVLVDGVDSSRRDGTKVFVPIKVSNVMITELNKSDQRRRLK
jgi:large subunit ribosomal protein L24